MGTNPVEIAETSKTSKPDRTVLTDASGVLVQVGRARAARAATPEAAGKAHHPCPALRQARRALIQSTSKVPPMRQ